MPSDSKRCDPSIPQGTISLSKQQEIADELLHNGREEVSFFIDPDAWMGCFPELEERDPHELKDEIIKRIRTKEEQFSSERKGDVIGAHALRLESMRKEYIPSKRGKRMLCLSSQKPLRAYSLFPGLGPDVPRLKSGIASGAPETPGQYRPQGCLLLGGIYVLI